MIQIAQDISSRMYVENIGVAELRRGFLIYIIGEIDKSGCVNYFPTVSNHNKLCNMCKAFLKY